MSLMTATKAIRAFVIGESYWRVRFANDKELSELDIRTYLDGEKILRARAVEWLEDVIGSGDLRNVKEVMLCTPHGTAHLTVSESYTVFQFSRGTLSALTGERIKNMQAVGVVIDRQTGECEYALWDQQERHLYTGITSVLNFHSWREGAIPIGRINIEALDLRGIG